MGKWAEQASASGAKQRAEQAAEAAPAMLAVAGGEEDPEETARKYAESLAQPRSTAWDEVDSALKAPVGTWSTNVKRAAVLSVLALLARLVANAYGELLPAADAAALKVSSLDWSRRSGVATAEKAAVLLLACALPGARRRFLPPLLLVLAAGAAADGLVMPAGVAGAAEQPFVLCVAYVLLALVVVGLQVKSI